MNPKTHNSAITISALSGCLFGLLWVAMPGALFVFILLCISIALIRKYSGEDSRYLIMLTLAAFIIRLAAMMALHLHSWGRGFWGLVSGDDSLYSATALQLCMTWKDATIIPSHAIDIYSYNLFSYLLGAFYYLFGYNYLSSKFINCLIGALIVIVTYIIAKDLFDEKVAKIAAFFSAFYPSMVVWCASDLKDPLITLLFTLGLYTTLKSGVKTRQGLFMFAISLLVCMALFVTVELVSYVLAISIIFRLAVSFFENIKQKKAIMVVLIIIVVSSGIFLVWHRVSLDFLHDKTLKFLNYLAKTHIDMSSVGNSRYSLFDQKFIYYLKEGVISWAGLFKWYLLGMAYFMFTPFPWDVTSRQQFFTMPQILLWYAMTPFIIMGSFKFLRNGTVRAAVFFCMLILGLSVRALTEGNIGAAFRHRDHFAPMLFIIAAYGISFFLNREEPRGED